MAITTVATTFPAYDFEWGWPGLDQINLDDVTPTVGDFGDIPPDATIDWVRAKVTWRGQANSGEFLNKVAKHQVFIGVSGQNYIDSGNGTIANPVDPTTEDSYLTRFTDSVNSHTIFSNHVSWLQLQVNPLTGDPWSSLEEALTLAWTMSAVNRTAPPGLATEPSDPENFFQRIVIDTFELIITWFGGTVVEEPTQTTASVPCCPCDCPAPTPGGEGGASPSPPAHAGDVLPPTSFFPVEPQCAGGGEMPVYEALVDSEVYL